MSDGKAKGKHGGRKDGEDGEGDRERAMEKILD